ncbi:hypothetical protein GOP47_0027423 [Adiantum capillus-veneris]|nr:hypothetical protein GOP47_0027423 [Adiantum capillus-veneris]
MVPLPLPLSPLLLHLHIVFTLFFSYYTKFAKSGEERCIKLSLSPRRVHAGRGQASKCRPRACNTVAEGVNNGGQSVESKGATLFLRGLQIDGYLWAQFTTKLMHHAADAVWFFGKWFAAPALILLALRDVVVAVATGNELCIPVGLLVGTLFTGILKETFSTLGIDFQHNVLPWHLLELELFFVILRIGASRIAPFWFRVFLCHFIIGGLWQTLRFCLDWKAKKEQVNSGSV